MRKTRPGKKTWSRPLAEFVQSVIDPAMARRGFGQSSLLLFWDDIAGERLAAISQPVKLQWPPHPHGGAQDEAPAPATLIIRVESGFALELQHLAPLIIERINVHFGWRCVGRLLLKQGPITTRPKAQPPAPPLDKAAMAAAQKLVGEIADESLRQALTRLGGRVLAKF